jgi:hypothetical protein
MAELVEIFALVAIACMGWLWADLLDRPPPR